MRVCVVGVGAVGSLFAAHVAQVEGVEVWGYDVVQPHVDAINRSGLRLVGEADLVGRVRATSDPAEVPPCEFGIVAVKSMFTEAAISQVAGAFAEGAVASVQNGVGNEETIAEHVERVIRGTTFPAGRVLEPGVVQMDTRGDTWLGPFEPRPASMAEVTRLADALTAGGMNTRALPDARGAQWTKLIFNAATNPVGALTRLTHGRVCELPETRRLVSVLVAEGVAVADAMGITLDPDPDELVDHAARVAYEHRASMLQDVLAERATEIDAMNGGIVRFGREHGVPTPLNEAIAALIKGLEHSWSQPR
jgi:2-dehydropantoate 2-reductase